MNDKERLQQRNKEIAKLYRVDGWNIFELGARFNLAPSTIRTILWNLLGVRIYAGGVPKP